MDDNNWLPRINPTTCIGCGDCIACCPTNALGRKDGKAALARPHLCTYCANCEAICPVSAIELPYQICKQEMKS